MYSTKLASRLSYCPALLKMMVTSLKISSFQYPVLSKNNNFKKTQELIRSDFPLMLFLAFIFYSRMYYMQQNISPTIKAGRFQCQGMYRKTKGAHCLCNF